MGNGEMTLLLTWFSRLGLQEDWRFAKQVGLQHVLERLVSGFWEHRLFLKNGKHTHGPLEGFDTGLQIHSEILKDPIKTFFLVLLLLKYEHVMVEELLEFLVGEVDTQLIETVLLENLETGDIQHTSEMLTFLFGVQSVVTFLNEELEQPVEDGFSHGTHGVGTLVDVLALGDEFSTDLNLGLADESIHLFTIDSEELSGLHTVVNTVGLSLLFTTLLFELHFTHVHDSSSNFVNVFTLFVGEVQDFESLVGGKKLFVVIDVRNGNFTLRDVMVVVDIISKTAHVLNTLLLSSVGHDLVENMVATFQRHLRDDTSLLEQVYERYGKQ